MAKRIKKKYVPKLIAYEGDDEVLICTPQSEQSLLKLWFNEGNRDVDDYDRVEAVSVMEIRQGHMDVYPHNS